MKKNQKLKILLEDKNIIIVNKDSNLLTVSNGREKENTLFYHVSEYLKKKNKNNKVFVVHRLDKSTSGLVLFAKNQKTKETLQSNWDNVVRKYYAIVHGKTKNEDTIISYLKETKTFISYSTNDTKNGKKAITKYKTISTNGKYSLIDINILTGRKNQIRVHMKDNNTPIVGDNKYGIKDKEPRMYLNAYYLKFIHPITKEEITIETELPLFFNNRLK